MFKTIGIVFILSFIPKLYRFEKEYQSKKDTVSDEEKYMRVFIYFIFLMMFVYITWFFIIN